MSLLSFVPSALAAVDMTAFGRVVDPIISNIIYPIVGLMFGIAVLVFVYGVIQMIIHGNDPDSRKKSQNTMMYGVIGLFIMVSAWGIIWVISNTVKELGQTRQTTTIR
jgi:large-conductance mechanosensitive channel